jgi:hypothetical protein
MDINEPKRGRGRPRLSDEEKKQRAVMRQQGELPPARVGGFNTYTDPGDNTKFLLHALAIRDLPKIDTSDPKQVEERLDWYFTHCAEADIKPTVKGFCNALGVNKQSLWQWKTGARRPDTHEEIILRAYDLLEEMWENYMQNGKINPVAGIFLGKNNFGYRDQQEYLLTPNQANQPVDPATIEAKYAELPAEED